MKYPSPLVPGCTIAITAFSSGVELKMHPRLDLVIEDFIKRGFNVIEGKCLRENRQHVSASKEARAAELMHFLLDDSIDAVVPPWGGELAMQILPLLDFDKIADAKPKWIFGFSDVSTICVAITTRCQWASAHCANFIDLSLSQTDSLTALSLEYLTLSANAEFSQYSSEMFQHKAIDYAEVPNAALNLQDKTRWKSLGSEDGDIAFEGRLLGGCLDTLSLTFNTGYFDFDGFQDCFEEQGVILYFENAELAPAALLRVLYSLKFKGAFCKINGLLIGRTASAAIDNAGLSYLQALQEILTDVGYPVLYDVDIGHKPPNLTLINGAFARVSFAHDSGKITQHLV